MMRSFFTAFLALKWIENFFYFMSYSPQNPTLWPGQSLSSPTSAQLSLESMQHLATQKFAFSTETAQIFRARKAKNSRIHCKIFASFSSVRCTKLLTSAKFSVEAAQHSRLSQCSVWQRKKFACNADSAEIVQIFRAKVRELVANFLRLWCTTHHKSSRRRCRTLKCRHRSRLRRRRVL